MLRMRCLKIIDAELMGGNMRGDGEHGHPAALRIEQAVDQMQIAGAAAASTYGELACYMRFTGGCEC